MFGSERGENLSREIEGSEIKNLLAVEPANEELSRISPKDFNIKKLDGSR